MKSPTLLQKIALLQLELYDYDRFVKKLDSQDMGTFSLSRLKWSKRVTLTYYLAKIIGIKSANGLIAAAVKMVEDKERRRVRDNILKLKAKGLKVVAVAGSYGKTSIKNNLYDILRTKYRVVATPESYNTIFGIGRCLAWEVDELTEIFIVEVGAYKIGDITSLLEMISPDYGVITGIARQHLDRFGSFENIKQAKGEIIDYMVKHQGVIAANLADVTVAEIVEKKGVQVLGYGIKNDRTLTNWEGARVLAKAIGMNAKDISKAKARPVKNRFEMTSERYGMLVIDDSFSSNDIGFKDALLQLGKYKKYNRILVTPGIVELGKDESDIHVALGKAIVGNADYVFLVGHSNRTKSLALGIGKNVPILYLDKTLDFMTKVKEIKSDKEPIVLIENDVTANYN